MEHGTRAGIAVLGGGRAGAPLAVALARTGAPVLVVDPDVAATRERLLRADPATAVPVASAPAAARDAAVVVDTLPERPALKREVLRRVGRHAPDAVLVSASLALPVDEVAEGTAYAGRAHGIRWLGPLGRTVELTGPPPARETIRELLAGAGLGVVPGVPADAPGPAVELVLELLNRAVGLLDAGCASRTDLDLALRAGCGWPRGPLELLEAIGLPTAVDVLDALHTRTGRVGHAAAPLLRRLAAAHGDAAVFPAGADLPGAAASRADVPRVERAGVVGTGTMAVGIAAALAGVGIATTVVGRTPQRAAAACEAAAAIVTRTAGGPAPVLTATDDPGRLAGCALVVEAVVEDLRVKRAVLGELDVRCDPGTVLATTTSSLAVLDCATATARPADVVGMHFFNPVASMPLVEVVACELTGVRATALAEQVARRAGKQVLRCADRAGFLVNRLLFPLVNDAVSAVAAGRADAAGLDLALRRTCGLPVGPLRLLDLVGADVALGVQGNLHREYGDPDLAPSAVLRALVADGVLGSKSGRSIGAALTAAA